MIANVQDVIDNEVAPADTPFLQNYHEFSEIHSYLDGLVAEFPTLASTSTIGKTYQGKDIKIITLSTDPKAKKPALWFDGGLHAREWIAVATVTYMADNLVRTYGKNADSTFLLDNFDVIFCPIINVDGYDYTWNGDRMWRKTRSPNSKSKCVGTDPNRKWKLPNCDFICLSMHVDAVKRNLAPLLPMPVDRVEPPVSEDKLVFCRASHAVVCSLYLLHRDFILLTKNFCIVCCFLRISNRQLVGRCTACILAP